VFELVFFHIVKDKLFDTDFAVVCHQCRFDDVPYIRVQNFSDIGKNQWLPGQRIVIDVVVSQAEMFGINRVFSRMTALFVVA